jgi:hypothetical protein
VVHALVHGLIGTLACSCVTEGVHRLVSALGHQHAAVCRWTHQCIGALVCRVGALSSSCHHVIVLSHCHTVSGDQQTRSQHLDRMACDRLMTVANGCNSSILLHMHLGCVISSAIGSSISYCVGECIRLAIKHTVTTRIYCI